MNQLKIAAVQMDVQLGDLSGNVERIVSRFQTACDAGADLVIFPECAVTGYCFDSREEALEVAEPLAGPAITALGQACQQGSASLLVGTLERDGEHLYNAAVLLRPDGSRSVYRKVHLPWLGVDRFTDFGENPFLVDPVGEARVGVNICYDSAFPESARVLSLAGADLIALPTNFPTGAEAMIEHVANVRAMENAVYFAAVNRVGTERGVRFIGQSRIADPLGRTIAQADATEEVILYATLDLQRCREKRIVRRPGTHVIDRFADRRPEFYHELIQPHDLPRPGRDEPV